MKSLDRATGIGKRVEALRILNNETRRSVADVLQVSPSYTSRLLDDKVNWSRENVERIAVHYHVSVDYVVSGVTVTETNMLQGKDQPNHLVESILFLETSPKKDMLKMVALSLKYLSDLIMKAVE